MGSSPQGISGGPGPDDRQPTQQVRGVAPLSSLRYSSFIYRLQNRLEGGGERGEGFHTSDLLCWLTVIWSGAPTDSFEGSPHCLLTFFKLFSRLKIIKNEKLNKHQIRGYVALCAPETKFLFFGSGGQISTKHLKTSIRPFFATCRLPQYPEFWRCVETGTLFLGPHWKRSLKGLDNLLTVTTPNTKLLHRPCKMSLSS